MSVFRCLPSLKQPLLMLVCRCASVRLQRSAQYVHLPTPSLYGTACSRPYKQAMKWMTSQSSSIAPHSIALWADVSPPESPFKRPRGRHECFPEREYGTVGPFCVFNEGEIMVHTLWGARVECASQMDIQQTSVGLSAEGVCIRLLSSVTVHPVHSTQNIPKPQHVRDRYT